MSALKDVKLAYFTYPGAAGVVSAAANVAAAGREVGLERVVIMSFALSQPDSPSPFGRELWLAEEVFDWAGLSYLRLRVNGLFFENLELFHREDVLGSGVIRNSFRDVAVPWIAADDAAKLAVAALLHVERFGNDTTVYPSGGYALSHNEIAGVIGGYIGRTLRHETITAEAWFQRLMALSARDGRINELLARHITAVGEALNGSIVLNDMFEAITGDKPTGLSALLKSGKLDFGGAAISAHGD